MRHYVYNGKAMHCFIDDLLLAGVRKESFNGRRNSHALTSVFAAEKDSHLTGRL